MTPTCQFNSGNKYIIVLENENTSIAYFSEFDEKAMRYLEKLENLFFGRT